MAGKKGMRSGKTLSLLDFPRKYTDDFLTTIDKRSSLSTLLRRRLGQLLDDMGGEENLSYAQRSLARRAIFLEALIQQSEEKAANGVEIEPTQHASLINSLIALYGRIGIERKVKDVVDLTEYIEANKQDAERSA